MTTLSFLKTKLVSVTLPDLAGTTYTPTMTNYGVWYKVQDLTFTAKMGTRYRVNASVHLNMNSLVVTGSDDIAVQYQWRLYNETKAQDVPTCTGTRNIFRAIVGATFDPLLQTQSMSEEFSCLPRSLLIDGNVYRLYIEVKKVQVTGSPTLNISVFDGTIYGPPPATVQLPAAFQGV